MSGKANVESSAPMIDMDLGHQDLVAAVRAALKLKGYRAGAVSFNPAVKNDGTPTGRVSAVVKVTAIKPTAV